MMNQIQLSALTACHFLVIPRSGDFYPRQWPGNFYLRFQDDSICTSFTSNINFRLKAFAISTDQAEIRSVSKGWIHLGKVWLFISVVVCIQSIHRQSQTDLPILLSCLHLEEHHLRLQQLSMRSSTMRIPVLKSVQLLVHFVPQQKFNIFHCRRLF